MKLYPVLFEAPKTPEQAIEAELGLFVYPADDLISVILIDIERCENILKSYLEKKGNLPVKKIEPVVSPTPPQQLLIGGPYDSNLAPWKINEAYESADVKKQWLTTAIGNRAIVGGVGVRLADTWRVSYSVAVEKYGPMLYDVAMASIYPEYLCSDYDLTAASQKVWNKMLERNDVEKIPVTELGDDVYMMVSTSFNVSGLTSKQAEEADKSIGDQEAELDSEWFENFVNSLPPEDKAKLGPFYGFRRKAGKDISKYNSLLKASDDIIDIFAGSMKLKRFDVEEAIEQAAIQMFKRFYLRRK